MKFFAVFLPMLDQEKSQKYRENHLAFLSQMEQEGKIIARGPFVDGTGGLVIYRAETIEEVKAFTQKDPYIIQKARGREIHEWAVISKVLNF